MGHKKDLGKWIKEITHDIIHHGDPSRLKDFGRDIHNTIIENLNNKKNTPTPVTPQEPQQHSNHTPTTAETHLEPSQWMGLPTLVLSTIGLVIFTLAATTLGILSIAIPATKTLLGILSAVFALPILPFIVLIMYGTSKRRLTLRTRRIIALLKEKNVRTLNEITDITGETIKTVKKTINNATKNRMLSGIRMDDQETCLIYGTEAYRLYRESAQRQQEQEADERERLQRISNPELAGLEKFNTLKTEVLQKIRSCCDTFPSSAINEKLGKLESIVEKIFIYIESHPKKLPLTRKFTSYYLPSTLKLIDKYQQFDKMDAEITRTTKDDIEKTLDTVYDAFCTLLEQLTEEDVLDVSTDIKVLETMLAQEGLTGQKFDIGKGVGIS